VRRAGRPRGDARRESLRSSAGRIARAGLRRKGMGAKRGGAAGRLRGRVIKRGPQQVRLNEKYVCITSAEVMHQISVERVLCDSQIQIPGRNSSAFEDPKGGIS